MPRWRMVELCTAVLTLGGIGTALAVQAAGAPPASGHLPATDMAVSRSPLGLADPLFTVLERPSAPLTLPARILAAATEPANGATVLPSTVPATPVPAAPPTTPSTTVVTPDQPSTASGTAGGTSSGTAGATGAAAVTATASTPPAAVVPSDPTAPTDANSVDTPDWACIREHESGDDYSDNTPSGYTGAYQFQATTWNEAVTGAGYGSYANGEAYLAPSTVQDAAALWLYRQDGWSPWSTRYVCGL